MHGTHGEHKGEGRIDREMRERGGRERERERGGRKRDPGGSNCRSK